MPAGIAVFLISAILNMGTDLRIESRAPTRIDLAGGTLDLWPLHLFLDHPTTINLGIDLHAEATLEQFHPSGPGIGPGKGRTCQVILRSEDQGVEQALGWDELATARIPPQLELHLKLLRIFALNRRPEMSLRLSTRARSPAGAGLGGSSTLAVAMIGALASWSRGGPIHPETEGERWIEIVRDIETTVIQVPAGVQDYYGAMFGGLQSLRWQPGRHRREWLPDELLPELERRILLFYSGQSRNSGINNWALFKAFIDNEGGVRERFARISEAARSLEAALRAGDWAAAGRAIREEWSVRRTLAPGLSTPEMDRAFETAARIAPERAAKICGAGGGGCFFIYLPDPSARQPVEQALASDGMRLLPFRHARRGLEVQVSCGA